MMSFSNSQVQKIEENEHFHKIKAVLSNNHTLSLISKPQEVGADGATTQGIKRPAGYWGMWGKCDSPYWLFTNMLDHIVKTNGKVIRGY